MKMGTIGTGMITEWLNTAFQDNGLECTAVYSRKEETGRRLADKYNMPKVYTDLDAMLHDEELDCIYIASPNSLHYSQAMKMCIRDSLKVTPSSLILRRSASEKTWNPPLSVSIGPE